MKTRHRGLTALDLIEEAVHLLRTAPFPVFGWYLFGATPFVVVLLYFWTDMSWSADARQDCAADSLFVAFGFIWMKFCQAMFARKLGALVRLEPVSNMTIRGRLRMFLQQAIIQPSKLFILPLALLVTLPFGWVCAFYENVTAFGEAKNLPTLWSKSWKQARLWPGQNHLALSVLLLFRCVTFLNILLIVFVAPNLIKMFSGLENVFTRSGIHLLNSTSLAVIASLTYLCCDPLMKAIYVLRCFYGESLQSGEDLQVELRRVGRKTAAIAAAFVIFASSVSILGAAPAAPSARAAIPEEELDRSITETIARPEFSWRMPREEATEKDKSPNAFDRFLRRFERTMGKWWRALWRWLDKMMPGSSVPTPESSGGAGISRGALELCLLVLCGVLAVFLAMKIRDRIKQSRQAPRAAPTAKQIDIAEESVTADQLPEDEWLRLARELADKREWRLALRAFFLAGLAHLSHRGLIALARHKSNREYQTELRRRAPGHPAVQDAFARNLSEVERAWYGRHEVDSSALENFQTNLETIRAI